MTEISIEASILDLTGGSAVKGQEAIQSLWSGYGSITRYFLAGEAVKSVVVKHINPLVKDAHPSGWNTDRSHQRKLKSYEVESLWYQQYNSRCDDSCRSPRFLGIKQSGQETLLVLEDLFASGFDQVKQKVTMEEVEACVNWLAHFHGTFMGETPEGLWSSGTYWHLQTRPDELQAMAKGPLKLAADAIDQRLNQSRFQTIVHGDAKLANFCFDAVAPKVAAVDFQYVGGGCGMKDLAYFIGGCFDARLCEQYEDRILNLYFSSLEQRLQSLGKLSSFARIEEEWRSLYPFAWADFHRFLLGWKPGHWKINTYSEKLVSQVLEQLGYGTQ
ncbi:MAG: choline kinase [Zetaproteobacteria bacterium]|nr:choline kinase [Pseudobdellovibrionaceae bacterium]